MNYYLPGFRLAITTDPMTCHVTPIPLLCRPAVIIIDEPTLGTDSLHGFGKPEW